MVRLLLVSSFLMLGVACNSNDFAGGSSRNAKEQAKRPGTSQSPNSGDGVPSPTLGNSIPDTNTGAVDPTGPSTNTGGGQNTPGTKSIFDQLKDLLKVTSDAVVDQPNENEVVFGGNKVFHIGDGAFRDSTCVFQIVAYARTGTKYYFEFEVKQPNTSVSIVIERVCGVDFGDTNFVHLMKDGTALQTEPVAIGATSLSFTTKTPLDAGLYSLMVESKSGTQKPGSDPNDHDDYVVGKLHVKASGPIKPGKVGAQD